MPDSDSNRISTSGVPAYLEYIFARNDAEKASAARKMGLTGSRRTGGYGETTKVGDDPAPHTTGRIARDGKAPDGGAWNLSYAVAIDDVPSGSAHLGRSGRHEEDTISPGRQDGTSPDAIEQRAGRRRRSPDNGDEHEPARLPSPDIASPPIPQRSRAVTRLPEQAEVTHLSREPEAPHRARKDPGGSTELNTAAAPLRQDERIQKRPAASILEVAETAAGVGHGLTTHSSKRRRFESAAATPGAVPSSSFQRRTSPSLSEVSPSSTLPSIPPELPVAKTCSNCRTSVTARWCTSKLKPGFNVCHSCYQYEKKHRHKKARPLELEAKRSLRADWHHAPPEPVKACSNCRSSVSPAASMLGVAETTAAAGSSAGTTHPSKRPRIDSAAATPSAVPSSSSGQRSFASLSEVSPSSTLDVIPLELPVAQTCSNCRASVTWHWLNSKLKPGSKVCDSCYQYERKHKKARPLELELKRLAMRGVIKGSKRHQASSAATHHSPTKHPAPGGLPASWNRGAKFVTLATTTSGSVVVLVRWSWR
ncbi:hypothetical protein DFH06DRAFT_1303424 [Mycena polygramma]|nr:hypothetical protein DFH06DRAFT_1303424 [Mycena polygramma]